MKQILVILSIIISCFCCSNVQAQTRISTETGTTGYDGANGLASVGCITFAVQNSNPYAINLESIETFKSATYLNTPATIELWYTAVALSSSSAIAAPDWVNAATTTLSTATIGYNKVFSGLTFSIPANTTYRFALVSNTGIAYSGNTSGSCSPQTLSADGVTLLMGEAQIAGANVGYSGNNYNATTTPRWFTGAISFIPSIPCTTPPNAGIATTSKTIACSGSLFNLSLSGATSGTGLTYQWQDSMQATQILKIFQGLQLEIILLHKPLQNIIDV